jgi:4-hydroxybutyrate dehydrogenase
MSLITYLTTVEFAAGALKTLPEALSALHIKRPLIVSDRGLAQTGLTDRVTALAPGLGALFLDVPSNPTEEAALRALADYREQGCDGVVAIGGGSPIDLAKAVALLATHEGPLSLYAAIEGGVARITPNVAPLIAVPTTAGTGSEVGRAALITMLDGRKLGVLSPHMIPKRAICDPELTLGLPPQLTAATGMDALSHCFETFLSPRYNPPADAIALDGAARIWRNLETACREGRDIEARTEMMMGALQGGLTFQKGLGAVHALSHALGGLKQPSLHHGALNAIFLAPVIEVNAGHVGDKLNRLAAALGLPSGSALPEAVRGLNRRLGLAARLRDLSVPQDVFPDMAARALADHSHPTNPRPLTLGDYAALLQSAW